MPRVWSFAHIRCFAPCSGVGIRISDKRRRQACLRQVDAIVEIACPHDAKRAKVVGRAYHRICNEFGGEIQVLTRAGFDDLRRVGGEDLAVAVTKVRTGQVE